jgi:hypothetical protein
MIQYKINILYVVKFTFLRAVLMEEINPVS